jgi:uncharacterized protein
MPSLPGPARYMAEPDLLQVQVVYALPDRQVLIELEVPRGTRVEQAVAQSALAERFTEIAARPLVCAIYGRPVLNSYVLRQGDRVEILRPLRVDPKESRRQAARSGRKVVPGR